MDHNIFLDNAAKIIGSNNLIIDVEGQKNFVTEWRGQFFGTSLAVARPGCLAEVSALLKLANQYGISIVPQGGNTGLVGGQIPDKTGSQLVLSLGRMNKIRNIDPVGNTITVEAGAILETVQAAADSQNRLFPLSLSAQGSCQIGGNLSTNAGGTGVLAYGNARDLVLGLEVVLPDGRIWNGLRSLRKDNTGYNLKQLFIGAEGTLGIITAACLKLYPKPAAREMIFAGCTSPHGGLSLLGEMSDLAGSSLTAFELMPRFVIELALRHIPGLREPLTEPHAWYILAEISLNASDQSIRPNLEEKLTTLLHSQTISDVAMATSEAHCQQFWAIRHSLSEAQKKEGPSLKHDVSLPVQHVPDFLEAADITMKEILPEARPCGFGHIGDGNVHYNISAPTGMGTKEFFEFGPPMNDAVYRLVREMNGSISAEHGIGQMKKSLMAATKDPVELELMRAIKLAIDPKGLMNPGKLL